jgi:hypothetical protein
LHVGFRESLKCSLAAKVCGTIRREVLRNECMIPLITRRVSLLFHHSLLWDSEIVHHWCSVLLWGQLTDQQSPMRVRRMGKILVRLTSTEALHHNKDVSHTMTISFKTSMANDTAISSLARRFAIGSRSTRLTCRSNLQKCVSKVLWPFHRHAHLLLTDEQT